MKRIETGKWCISHDGEIYTADDYETKDEAIQAANEEYQWSVFYVAKVVEVEFDPRDICISDRVYEQLSEQLFEEVGEVSETWDESVSKEQLEELDKMIGKTVIEWINKNNLNPKCYGVTEEILVY